MNISFRPPPDCESCYTPYLKEEVELIQTIKQEIKNMTPAQVWINYYEKDRFVRPSEEELQNIVRCKSSGSTRIFSFKTNDGRYWQITQNEAEDYVLQQHNEEGYSSNEYWKKIDPNHFRTVLSRTDWEAIEKIILSKLTRK